jgi:hypothetical protein
MSTAISLSHISPFTCHRKGTSVSNEATGKALAPSRSLKSTPGGNAAAALYEEGEHGGADGGNAAVRWKRDGLSTRPTNSIVTALWIL